MAITRPTGEQLRFASANTGEHILDTYMEAAEIGGRTLSDLLDDLFDPADNGTFRSENFEFRYHSDKLQFRAGVFSNSSASWVDVTTFFSIEGAFSTSTAYNNFDLVTVANSDVYIVYGLSSAQAFNQESAFISSSNTKKIVDVSGAQAQAAIASDHRADAGKYAVTAEDATFSLTSTNGGTSGLYSAKHYQAKASANATTATSQATISSNHRADAAKYTSTAHNTTFTLTSTNGGTSGLYSALHYATEASNSASTASGHKDTASNQASAPTTTLSTGSAKAWALGGGSGFTMATAVAGSDYSSKYYADQADQKATLATTQSGLSSDHRADAAKYAVTAHNTTFTLTSTNGGTSGLYSAKHYAAEAAASATAASNTASAIGNFNSLSDVVISDVGNLELIQYDTTTSKFINRTATEAGIATVSYVDAQIASEDTIAEMNDTTIDVSVGDNEILQYNNSTSKWENQTLAEAGILTGNETITLSGDVSGSGTTSIAVTIADDSHNHTIANVDDLQTTLDAKSTASKTETLTNKTFDVEGTGNSVSNIDVANLKSGVLDTDISSGVSGSDDTLASAKAIKAYADTKLSANQTITLSGDASGSGTTAITVTVADDSHNHIIGNVDGLQAALDAKADLANPALTGNPTAPTQSAGNNSTRIATTEYTDTAISNLVDTAPGTLNTLNELAAALGDDANFSTTITSSIATKMPLAGGTFTGGIIGTTATFSDNITSRKAGDVELTVHADSTSGPESALLLMRGTNNTFGADTYNDWKIENGYGKSGSAGGTLRIQRGYNGGLDTYWEWDASGNAVSYANITSSGTLNISGATGTAQLQVNLTDSTAYNHSIKCYSPNMTQGQYNQFHLGESGGSYNTGVIGYYWHSAGSAANNYLEIGHWSNGDLIKVYGDRVEITDPLTVTGTNKLQLGDSGTYIHQSADGVLDLVADVELELNGAIVDVNSTNGNVDISATGGNIQLNGDTGNSVKVTGVLETTGNIELGHASDTTISRASAGVVNINSNAILTTATGATSDDVTALAIALG